MVQNHYEYIDNLVAAAKAGEVEALVEIASWYRYLIERVIQRCVTREHRLAPYKEDMESDVLLVLGSLIADYDNGQPYFSYYLSTRLERAIFNRSKRLYLGGGQGFIEVSMSDLPNEWEPVDESDPFGQVAENEMLKQALASLNDNQRAAIDLYYFHGMSQESAAGLLGITQASFSKRLQRALKSLRESIGSTE